jgi:hypothetical protein
MNPGTETDAMSQLAPGDDAQLADLTSVSLDRVAQLCEEAARDLTPDDAADRPALRRALRRIEQQNARPGETFVVHQQSLI